MTGLKGFTGAAFDAMNPYFAYEAIRPDGDFNRSYDAFQSGDVLGGLEEGAYGALGLLGVNGARGVKGFNTPLTMQIEWLLKREVLYQLIKDQLDLL